MAHDSGDELDYLRFAPRGEMAVVAGTDDSGEDESDAPDTIPNPPSASLMPQVQHTTLRPPPASERRERSFEDAVPPSA
jgi:hypothetical protein